MKLAVATLSVMALLMGVGPARADPANASTYWDRQHWQASKTSRPYALTGEYRRSGEATYRPRTVWIGGGRERRTVFELD
jgi:hypothetical protein